jgi:predicted glycoside hydrolase/deacetylase ChbG (UPF0249 family)
VSATGADRVRLIVNADDFGRARGVSRGIVEAHLTGIVTSTTLMANLPWAGDALERNASAPSLALGLHLNWCYGPPAADDIPSLLGGDGRLNRDLVALATLATERDVEREARAQLDRFVELTGRLPTHLDSHLHLHTWPICRSVVLRLAGEYGLPVRGVGRRLRADLRATGIDTTDGFIDDFFVPGQLSLERLIGVIEALEPGVTELMVHPGYDDEWLADSSFRTQREDELAVLTHPEVRAALARRGVVLGEWSMVTAPATGARLAGASVE